MESHRHKQPLFDKSPDLGQFVLGGPNHPYPRCYRTGYAHTDTDHSSEKRIDNDFIFNFVPKDEKFSSEKTLWFLVGGVVASLHTLSYTLYQSKDIVVYSSGIQENTLETACKVNGKCAVAATVVGFMKLGSNGLKNNSKCFRISIFWVSTALVAYFNGLLLHFQAATTMCYCIFKLLLLRFQGGGVATVFLSYYY